MNHVWILGASKTGGSWTGTVLGSGPTTKYLWEPTSGSPNGYGNWTNVTFDRRAYERFGERWKNRPDMQEVSFHKAEKFEHMVAKVTHWAWKDFRDNLWANGKKSLLDVRQLLGAKIIQLARHPVRRAGSMQHNNLPVEMLKKLDDYAKNFADFRAANKDELWYLLTRHEDLVTLDNRFEREFQFAGIEMHEQTKKFLDECHNEDAERLYRTKDSTLNKWQSLPQAVIDHCNELVKEYFEGVYECV